MTNYPNCPQLCTSESCNQPCLCWAVICRWEQPGPWFGRGL